MSIWQLALTLFLVTNPLGNSPTIIALVKDHSLRGQQKILFREAIFSAILAFFFLFLGEIFLQGLRIEPYALTTSGGVLLFVVALKMIFSDRRETKLEAPKQDPFIVPIATPLLSGAGLLTTVMLFSKQESNDWKVFWAIFIAWIGVTFVLVTAPYLQVILGKRGLAALEQLMGMLLAMMSIEMVVNGMRLFFAALALISTH